MAKRIYGPDTSAYAGAGTGQGPALIKPQGTPTQFGATDPRAFLSDQFEQFKERYKGTYKRLRTLHGDNAEAFNRDIAELDADAEQFEAQMAYSMGQIEYIQALIDSGYDPEAGLRAQQEAAGIRLPAEPHKGAPSAFSVGQYGAHVRMAQEAGEAAIVDPWGFIRASKRKHADPDKLVDQYRQYRAKIRYDLLSYDEKIQADLAFDEGMGANDKTFKAWQKVMQENPEVKALRTYDPGLMAVAAKKVLGKSVSPLGKALEPKPRTRPIFGVSYPLVHGGGTPPVRRQLNRATGQTRVSYDGGKTWQIE